MTQNQEELWIFLSKLYLDFFSILTGLYVILSLLDFRKKFFATYRTSGVMTFRMESDITCPV